MEIKEGKLGEKLGKKKIGNRIEKGKIGSVAKASGTLSQGCAAGIIL